ncbi:MAG: hypothetical protein K9W42_14185 [Candidatus Heimdallarchaeota archaeon]|nr:hypothetical protein [Candidatus Heimdallarchaeota archaeon]
MKKKVFISFTALPLIVAILLSTTSVSALEVSWPIGVPYEYGFKESFYMEMAYTLEDGSVETKIQDLSNQFTFFTNITAINNVTQYVDFDFMSIPSQSHNSLSYSMANYLIAVPSAATFLPAFTQWDFLHNESVLAGFDITLPARFFLEPNWTIFNTHYKSLLNTSSVLHSYVNPYNSSKTEVYTLGDLLAESNSYSIMGVENDLEAAKAKFTPNNRGFSFSIDVAGTLKYNYYNGTHTLYIPTYKALFSSSFQFTIDGVLEHYRYSFDFGINYPKVSQIAIQNYAYTLGGIPSESSSFPTLLVVPTALATILLIVIVRKEKKKV